MQSDFINEYLKYIQYFRAQLFDSKHLCMHVGDGDDVAISAVH